MRPGLALMRYEISTGEQKANHVLIWKRSAEGGRIASKQGGAAYFCSTSCRATWNRSHRNQDSVSSDRA